MDLHQIFQDIRPLVYEAGKIALRHFKIVAPERKQDKSFVTDADREVETFLRGEMQRRFPDYGFLGEEFGLNDVVQPEYVWAIDPIDGTAPFVFGLPVWAVSVGLVSREGPILGFVYLPVVDELYWSYKGERAYCNDEVLEVHPPSKISFGSTILTPSITFRRYNVKYRGRALSLGSAAAIIAYTAKGRIEAGMIDRIKLYDIAGGAAVLHNAGGVMHYLSGRPVDFWELIDGRKTPESLFLGHPENVEQMKTLFSYKEGYGPAPDDNDTE